MARYIDAGELYCRVKERTNPYGKPTLDYESGVKVLDLIITAPTADVVPKSEVITEFAEAVKHIADGVKFKSAIEKTAFVEMLEDMAKIKKGG